jgi:hypothetical protein
MKRLHKALVTAGIVALVAFPMHSAEAYWGPGYGAYGWRHAYRYDPYYRYAPPHVRSYIRRLYRYGSGYAPWRTWMW